MNNRKVLIVDDSEMTRDYHVYILKNNGFAVESAIDGADALEKLYRDPEIKLIITDINMPNMDGYTLIRKIRENSDFDDIPIIIISTEDLEKTKAIGLKIGADVVLEKPIDEKMLINAVNTFLNM